MSNTFFSIDGSYGSGTDILVVDTSSWTEEDWNAVDEASDSERLEVARNLTIKE
jgi:hypothetical protein